jgi:SAM-dependent methyltransferase
MTAYMDVAKLIADYDLAHHKRAADAYFSRLQPDDLVRRKPFASAVETTELLSGLATLLHGLQIFRGAKVLDFGCGTGWITRAIGLLGCEAYGVDLSASGVLLARELTNANPQFADLPIFFSEFDGERLPFDDEVLDAAICFDVFHHLHNPIDVLREFHRVLKPGGRIGFHEPGPNHACQPQSQMEMRNYGVIENNIDVWAIDRQAQAIGFRPVTMAVYFPSPLWTDVRGFDHMIGISTEHTASVCRKVLTRLVDLVRRRSETHALDHLRKQFNNLRVFMLEKSGERFLDSRQPHGLASEIKLISAVRESDDTLSLNLSVKNTGSSTWMPSSLKLGGSVNIGIKLFDKDGKLTDNDFARVPLSTQQVSPGDSIEVTSSIVAPTEGTLKIDLVAENVAWFEQQGSAAIMVPLSMKASSDR